MTNPVSKQRSTLRRIAARLTAQRRGCRVPALYLLTDDDREVDWAEAVSALPRGGAVIVRSRDARRRQSLALNLKTLAARKGVLLLIADDPKLAFRIRAAGIHRPDFPNGSCIGIQRLMPDALITFAAHTPQSLVRGSLSGAHVALVSPIFPTSSHSGQSALGPLRWALVSRRQNLPVVALGGISPQNAPRAVAAGAQGLALIGSWVSPVRS